MPAMLEARMREALLPFAGAMPPERFEAMVAAVVRAAVNYDPAEHGCSEEGYTYIVNGVYLTVQRAVNEARDRKERQAA